MSQVFVQESLDKVAAAGVTITKPDKQPFRDAAKPMLEKYRDTEIGKLAKKIILLQIVALACTRSSAVYFHANLPVPTSKVEE